MLADQISFFIPVIFLVGSILRTTFSPAASARRNYSALRERGIVYSIFNGFTTFIFAGACATVAWSRASFALLWGVLAVVFILGATILGAVLLVHRFVGLESLPDQPPLDDERLRALVRKRRIRIPFQIAFLIAWIYSWRGVLSWF